MIPRILVAAPTSDKKDYCFNDYAEQVNSFTYPNYDVFMVDNSEDDKYVEKIWSKGIDTEHIEPGGSPIEFIALSQNIIRNKVLKEGYNWLLMLESDVFVPKNIIEYLIMYSNEVHTFSYFIMEGAKTSLCLQSITTQTAFPRGMRVDPLTSFALFTGEVKPINEYKIGYDAELYATGLGCTFIHRSVLEKIEFRIDKKSPHIFSDSYFFLDLKKMGIPVILDTTLIPEHRRGDAWQTDLRLIA